MFRQDRRSTSGALTNLASTERDSSLGVAGMSILAVHFSVPRLEILTEVVLRARPDQAV